jgi:hypothetical protein
VGAERNGYGVFALGLASKKDRLWLYAFPGVLRWDSFRRREWREDIAYYISETKPNAFTAESFRGRTLHLHISQREDGCGIPSITRDEALLAVVGHKASLLGRRASS